MRQHDESRIIKTLDNQPRVLFWDVDEFLVLFLPLLLGIGIGSILIMLLGIPLKFVFSKTKSKRGVPLKHRMYWMLPSDFLRKRKGIHNFPDSHIRDIVL
ncbi:MAG: type IV conjugative transfer system protein TraL [Waddliaceae bacterium]|nr:type IV conjugative transfer system protein TraL [Waddliaceae bacterium]|tara:strand:+ start:491 stop:790 length:300 start_codon:yes stop_codon:yes gene_type:complete